MNHIGFTGTQQGMTPEQRYSFREMIYLFRDFRFHHGCCIGADEDSHKIVRPIKGVFMHFHPPLKEAKAFKWEEDIQVGDSVSPRGEYLERDRAIVDQTEMLISTPKSWANMVRSGTWYTIRYAMSCNKDVHVLWPDGTSEKLLKLPPLVR